LQERNKILTKGFNNFGLDTSERYLPVKDVFRPALLINLQPLSTKIGQIFEDFEKESLRNRFPLFRHLKGKGK
jgi:hypothetical protein